MVHASDDSAPVDSVRMLQIWIGRVAGPLLAFAMYALLGGQGGAPEAARIVAAVGALMATLWLTEALPLPITSLMPLVLFPLLGVMGFSDAATPYADQYVFLFMGGFMLAAAIEQWQLHRRLALVTLWWFGTRPARLVGGFMLATALVSMWISNSAAAMLMLPMALSVVELLSRHPGPPGTPAPMAERGFEASLLLGIAYAASIGGLATLVGTPPNAFLAGFLKDRGVAIGFGQWMLLGVPLMLTLLVIAWVLLTRIMHPVRAIDIPGGRDLIRGQLASMGPVSRGQWTVLAVFGLTALLWIVREPLSHWPWLVSRVPAITRVNDSMIALAGALLLFAIPVDLKRNRFALDWPSASKLPWGVLLLFGGGLSLAEAGSRSGFTEFIGERLAGLGGLADATLIVVVTFTVIFLTEFASNTATATALMPIMYSLARGLELDPLLLVVPTTLAASCGFMMPAGTPPNAIVFGSGRVTIGEMAKSGLWLNLITVALMPWFMYTLGRWALGIRM